MSILSVASRTPLEGEREENDKKKAPFLLQIWYLERTLPQNTPQLGSPCYTVRGSVQEAISPIEELELWCWKEKHPHDSYRPRGHKSD